MNAKRKSLAGVVLALLPFCAVSAETTATHYLTSGFVSHHAKGDYRENNYGIGYEIRQGRFAYSVGYFRNSLDRDTFYGAVGYHAWTNGPVSVGLVGGLATGYPYPVVPMVIPFLELTLSKSIELRFFAIPPIPDVTPFTAAAQLKWRFK